MTLLTAENISKRFDDQIILDQVSFTIVEGERIALVGKNGIGKTTLLELLADMQRADSGRITRARQCLIDYVEQEKTEYLDQSLFEFVAGARHELLDLRRRIRELEHHLEKDPNDSRQLEQLGSLQQMFEQQDGFNFDNNVETILTGLGFPGERYHDRLRNFSGGERNRAGLARILAGRGNLLLLDEPTNHLDIESTTWLEEYLVKLDKSCLIVSHDRAFLSATAEKVWEMAFGGIETYVGGIDKYLTERTERQQRAEHRYQHQQEEIKRIEDFIRRNMAGQKTKQAQSKLKYLSRIKRLPPPRSDVRGPTIAISSSGRSYARVLSVENVSLGYGDHPILEHVNFNIYRGDKVGLIGRNGSGKSTLLRALIGELAPSAGGVKLGNNVDVAYFDQELSNLNDEVSLLDNIWEVDTAAGAGKLRSFLARFGFVGDDAFKKVAALSGGEKTKLCMARLLYNPANFVILDEPTNHLDMSAREALEKALQEYDGSCLVVSHDRYFLDQVVNRIIYLSHGRATLFDGNYRDFQLKVEASKPPPRQKNDQQKLHYQQFKELSKRRARHKKQIETTRSRISETEVELTKVEDDLLNNVPKSDWERLQTLSEQKKQLEETILQLYLTLEQLEATRVD